MERLDIVHEVAECSDQRQRQELALTEIDSWVLTKGVCMH